MHANSNCRLRLSSLSMPRRNCGTPPFCMSAVEWPLDWKLPHKSDIANTAHLLPIQNNLKHTQNTLSRHLVEWWESNDCWMDYSKNRWKHKAANCIEAALNLSLSPVEESFRINLYVDLLSLFEKQDMIVRRGVAVERGPLFLHRISAIYRPKLFFCLQTCKNLTEVYYESPPGHSTKKSWYKLT